MAITFDDLPASRMVIGVPEVERSSHELLRQLRERGVKVTGFVNAGKVASGTLGRGATPEQAARTQTLLAVLGAWLDGGHELGNHTETHPDLHRVPVEDFLADVERGEVLLEGLLEDRGAGIRYFRHPFLHTGRSLEVRDRIHRELAGRGIRVAPVTIDNSDYLWALAYDRLLDRQASVEELERLATEYVDYIDEVSCFYAEQSRRILGYELPQILLLHANRLNAATVGALVDRLAERGFRFVSLDKALLDPAYSLPDEYVGAGGISWLHRWAITRGVDRSIFRGEPVVPDSVRALASSTPPAEGRP